jgi:bifunctional DNA-binding transcriptional regulator/antitoxin component of YhaV-PrlF toxin-antitoxin module
MELLTEVISVEDELAIILPAEVLKRLKVSVGDSVDLTETASGFRISRDGAGIDPLSKHNE